MELRGLRGGGSVEMMKKSIVFECIFLFLRKRG
jgi:hypothetical protein